MIESPLLQQLCDEFEAKGIRRVIRKMLKLRLGDLPTDLDMALENIADVNQLYNAIDCALQCADMESFRQKLVNYM